MTAPNRLRPALFVALLAVLAPRSQAQVQTPTDPMSDRMATRARLSAAAAELERQATAAGAGESVRSRARADASAIRARLTAGDFRAGDRIAVRIDGQLTLNDTLTVLASVRLALPGFVQIPLQGVLRSEVEELVRTAVGDVVKGATVVVHPLMRLAVFGAVSRPGYVSVPDETTVDDLLMRAGGPLSDAAIDKIEFKRGETVLVGNAEVRRAIAERQTVGVLKLVDGDALQVPKVRPPWGRTDFLQIVGLVLTPLLTIFVVKN